MNREIFERTFNAPMARHAAHPDEYQDPRTRDLWVAWKAASVVMADRIKANLRRRKQGQVVAVVRSLDDACLAIDSMLSKK